MTSTTTASAMLDTRVRTVNTLFVETTLLMMKMYATVMAFAQPQRFASVIHHTMDTCATLTVPFAIMSWIALYMVYALKEYASASMGTMVRTVLVGTVLINSRTVLMFVVPEDFVFLRTSALVMLDSVGRIVPYL